MSIEVVFAYFYEPKETFIILISCASILSREIHNDKVSNCDFS